MTTSRRVTWLIFIVCALLVVDGLGWVTWQMLSLERSEREARERAARQEAARLALWRMDALLAPIIAAEAARPYFHYRSFFPEDRAYTRMWEAIEPGDVLLPSPMLADPGPFIRLHFEGSAQGWLTSPQVPDQALRDRAEEVALSLTSILDAERKLLELTAIIRGTTLDIERDADTAPRITAEGAGDELLAQRRNELQTLAQSHRERADASEPHPAAPPAATQAESDETGRSIAEFAARQQAADIARRGDDPRAPDPDTAMRKADAARDQPAPADAGREAVAAVRDVRRLGIAGAESPSVHTGPMTPVWLRSPLTGEPELLFIRAVRIDESEMLQGFWVDWPALRQALLATSADLLPDAALVPVIGGPAGSVTPVSTAAADAGRLLAGIPAALNPGPALADIRLGLTPTRTVLVIAWAAVLAAVVAIAFVLRASLSLSERRGRFVSAVTHELRTPLTTFCLYSQMLADGMVRDDSKRSEYLRILRDESDRLAGIVENVLAYARMGAATRRGADAATPVGALLDEAVPSLRALAEQAGMTLEVHADEARDAAIAADRDSVERVLRNLVDNACKYARNAESVPPGDNRIVLSATAAPAHVEFSVRDSGPGVPRRERRRIFSPFVRARTADEPAAAGLGLGLALSRGVARSLGGDLRLRPTRPPGAEFVLTVPRAG